jgi:hypothetical protein
MATGRAGMDGQSWAGVTAYQRGQECLLGGSVVHLRVQEFQPWIPPWFVVFGAMRMTSPARPTNTICMDYRMAIGHENQDNLFIWTSMPRR